MKPTDKKFGISFAVIFIVISITLFIRNNNLIAGLLFLVALILLIITKINSSKLSKINNYWYQTGLILARIVNPITLGVIYFLLITPVALFLRLILRRKFMKIKIENKDTYWEIRQLKIQKNSFYNQY